MTKARSADADTANCVFTTACRLFYAHGVRAVGIDWIVEESGVAKTSLYRHFATKDRLVAAFLEKEDREFWVQWDQVVATAAGDPMSELMFLFDWIGQRVSRDGYRGCPQINVAAEFSDPGHASRAIRARHKQAMFDRLAGIVGRIRAKAAPDVALQLALLIDGAFTSDGRLKHAGAARILKSAARALLASKRAPAARNSKSTSANRRGL